MFEQLRKSIEDLLQRATKPEDRREVVHRMKDTIVQATMGVQDLRDGLALTIRKLEAEKRELETVLRRKELATGIQDAETIAVAERFERQHMERVMVLEAKVAAQTREVELGERELAEMKADLRTAMAAAPPPPGGVELEDPLEDGPSAAGTQREIDALARARARADRDAEAEKRLEELKRNMGR